MNLFYFLIILNMISLPFRIVLCLILHEKQFMLDLGKHIIQMIELTSFTTNNFTQPNGILSTSLKFKSKSGRLHSVFFLCLYISISVHYVHKVEELIDWQICYHGKSHKLVKPIWISDIYKHS